MQTFFKKMLPLWVVLASVVACTKAPEQVLSPNGRLRLEFSIIRGKPSYALWYNDSSLIRPSALGFRLMNDTAALRSFELMGVDTVSVDRQWEQPWGEQRHVTDRYRALTVRLRETAASGRVMHIEFRLFDQGLGFRYSFPPQPGMDSVQIAEELTQFSFAEQPHVWWIPVHSENSFYESFYRRSKLSETDTINTPATFETNRGLHVAIHEANLTDFASMTLRRTDSAQYTAELVPWSTGVKVYTHAPFVSPWRTLLVAPRAADLIGNTLMLNLNEPSAIGDLSWVEPAKYIGIWWGMHINKYTWGQGPTHGATTANTKQYIDFAAQHGFKGVLVEGWNQGWDGDWAANGDIFSFTKAYPDFDLEAICAYGAEKKVRLIGHHETAGSVRNYEAQIDSAFALYQRLGVRAVKTGYVGKYLDKKEWHDGQFGVQHYRRVVEKAAKYQILIDNHEPVKGTGLQRTYPNLMTQEGGRGQEYNAWSADGGNTPAHTATLPFTRMLAGPFDFTPGIFDFSYRSPQGARVPTTLAKQLALYVVIFSPLQMAADLPEHYQNHPAFQFIVDVPCVWHETLPIDGAVGQFVSLARKDWHSQDWYLGCITNEQPRQQHIALHFLSPRQRYRAELYLDGPTANYRTNQTDVRIEQRTVFSTDTLHLSLAAGGGAAVRFVPIQ